MTEKEYIDASDLGKVKCLFSTLKNITPDMSDVINSKDYQKVMKQICIWQEELFIRSKVNE